MFNTWVQTVEMVQMFKKCKYWYGKPHVQNYHVVYKHFFKYLYKHLQINVQYFDGADDLLEKGTV